MAKFVTIGYGDREGYDGTPPDIRKSAHAHDKILQIKGAIIGMAGQPVQVRNTLANGVSITTGAFMNSEMTLAGFAIIDADTLESARFGLHGWRWCSRPTGLTRMAKWWCLV